MLNYLTNVLSGTYAHWNDTHNLTVRKLWEEAERWNPDVRDAYRSLLTTSTSVMDALIGPDRRMSITESNHDLKRLTAAHYMRVYEVLPLSLLYMLPWSETTKDDFVRRAPRFHVDHWHTIRSRLAGVPKSDLASIGSAVSDLVLAEIEPLGLTKGGRRIKFQYALTTVLAGAVQYLTQADAIQRFPAQKANSSRDGSIPPAALQTAPPTPTAKPQPSPPRTPAIAPSPTPVRPSPAIQASPQWGPSSHSGGLRDGIISRLYRDLHIDAEWAARRADGFSWWPAQLEQRITVSQPVSAASITGVRVQVETDVARGGAVATAELPLLQSVNRQASFSAATVNNGTLTLSSSVLVHSQNREWAVQLCGFIMGLQYAEAMLLPQIVPAAKLTPAVSSHPVSGMRTKPDEWAYGALHMVQAGADQPLPARSEFERIQAGLGLTSNDAAAKDASLEIAVPFQYNKPALLEVNSDATHPRYGRGVLILLYLPLDPNNALSRGLARVPFWSVLNQQSLVRSAQDGATHALGGWVPLENGNTALNIFIPAVLGQFGLVQNLVLGTAARATRLARACSMMRSLTSLSPGEVDSFLAQSV